MGFRHFSTYKLLRKTSVKRFKKNFIEINKKEDITESNWCSVISECGWLTWCNSYNLYKKYIFPLVGKVGSYYCINKRGKKKNNKGFLLFLKYNNAYKNNLKIYKNYYSHKKIHKKENDIIETYNWCKMSRYSS